MKKRSFKYKKALGITLALAVFLGGIGVVQRILDNHTSDFEDESVVKVEENKDNKDKKEEKTIETLKAPVKDGVGIVRYFYNKEFFITLCRYIFHLPLHLHDAVFVEVCRRIGGKRVGDECTGSILLLFCVESGTDVTTLGSVVGFFDNVW